MRNLFCETIEQGPRQGKLRIRQIPGLPDFTTLPDQPLRGLLAIDSGNRLFAVGGSTVYEVFPDGSFLAATGDSLAVDPHPAFMATNGLQLAISSGGLLYIVNGTGPGLPAVVNQVQFVGGGPVKAASVDFLDQYFIVNAPSTKQIFISALADGETWDPVDTALKEGYPDNIARVFADNEQLWLFGFDTTETDVATSNIFPFQRIQGAVSKVGCSAPYSVAGVLGFRAWLFKGAVYGAYGTTPERISDYGVEEAIKTYGNTVDAEAWCYTSGGHVFYVLSFPNVGKTWVYDKSVKGWHERGFWDAGQFTQYRGRVYAQAFNKDLVGDYKSGKIFVMDPKVYTDAGGVALRRQQICPYLTDNMKNSRFNQLTIDGDTGIGLDVAPDQPGYDPQIIMKYSKNRGKSYGNERQASMGRVGENETRVIFNQLGSSRIGMVFDVVVTDPVPIVYNTAYLKIGAPEGGR